ncbi:methyltransferase domain-containing protein [Ditylenchus destructor]|uniref:Methyltransferase domain-containing protein n=1 Tax=Ditylenchus destructor TaxID=166010 RepID=A0AAD4MLE8_9BILA|nr:methyltransferase domain-containing protein [Ditylenchus destructor]
MMVLERYSKIMLTIIVLLIMLFIVFVYRGKTTAVQSTTILKDTAANGNVLEVLDATILLKYKDQIDERKHELRAITNSSIFLHFYPVLVFCVNIARFGRVGDGGKWVCNAHRIPDKCAFYSLGINNEPSFDVDLQRFTNNRCKYIAVDRGDATPETLQNIENANGTYLKATVGNTPLPAQSDGTETVSLRSLMSRYGDTNIEVLKVDIEGAEREILAEMTEVPICQILIELHFGTPLETLEFIRRLSQNNFYLFRQEVNPAGMHLSEYSFIHRNCLEKYGVTTIYGHYLN